jgi:hypothetical protein
VSARCSCASAAPLPCHAPLVPAAATAQRPPHSHVSPSTAMSRTMRWNSPAGILTVHLYSACKESVRGGMAGSERRLARDPDAVSPAVLPAQPRPTPALTSVGDAQVLAVNVHQLELELGDAVAVLALEEERRRVAVVVRADGDAAGWGEGERTGLGVSGAALVLTKRGGGAVRVSRRPFGRRPRLAPACPLAPRRTCRRPRRT